GHAELPDSNRIVDNPLVGPPDAPRAYCEGGKKAAAEAAREKTIRAANTFRGPRPLEAAASGAVAPRTK
ncbi:MAG: hypothetical protein IJI73_01305, partial [Kiritimatiellae bacterium]|nr:hypothetical protein [Kiritimatiellia bacterium]